MIRSPTVRKHDDESKRVFVGWFNSVKGERVGDRTRICSEREKKARLEYNLELIKA